jgi:predicted AlkP superfamily pyrophosphatase or phosphodiesterase
MIAEFDAMVGEYVAAVEDAGLTARTIFIVTSDHGDMQMEQQQVLHGILYSRNSVKWDGTASLRALCCPAPFCILSQLGAPLLY